jgi:hypothetical protein
VIAHVGGVPAEELLVPVMGTGTALLVLARSWIMVRVHRAKAVRRRGVARR